MSLLRRVPPDSAFDSAQLKRGTLVELEHTDSWNTAKTIAKHHLLEDRDYYVKLARIHENMRHNPTFYTSRDDNHYHRVEIDFEESDPPAPDSYNNNPVDWAKVGTRLAVPLSGVKDDDFTPNPSGAFWTLVSAAGAGLSSYHGYKRNAAKNPIAWALWWGLWGSVLPIITLPIAVAQGYAEPKAGEALGAYYYDE